MDALMVEDQFDKQSNADEDDKSQNGEVFLRRRRIPEIGYWTPTNSQLSQISRGTDLRRKSGSPDLSRRLITSESRLKRGLSFPAASPASPHTHARKKILAHNQHSRLYKVIVVGEVNTGKSALVRRYVHNFFSSKGDYRATLGVDFQLKLLHYNDELEIRLQLWDIAGQERFCNMTRAYYKGAVGALIVFDSTNAKSFEAVAKWKRDLDSKCQTPDDGNIPCLLISNKSDLKKDPRLPDDDTISKYVQENGFIAPWYKTSAKTGEGVQCAMTQIVRRIMFLDTWSLPLDLEADQSSDFSMLSESGSTEDTLVDSDKPIIFAKTKRQMSFKHFCGCQ